MRCMSIDDRMKYFQLKKYKYLFDKPFSDFFCGFGVKYEVYSAGFYLQFSSQNIISFNFHGHKVHTYILLQNTSVTGNCICVSP